MTWHYDREIDIRDVFQDVALEQDSLRIIDLRREVNTSVSLRTFLLFSMTSTRIFRHEFDPNEHQATSSYKVVHFLSLDMYLHHACEYSLTSLAALKQKHCSYRANACLGLGGFFAKKQEKIVRANSQARTAVSYLVSPVANRDFL
eukprot:3417990-Amphidinium_carterae.4